MMPDEWSERGACRSVPQRGQGGQQDFGGQGEEAVRRQAAPGITVQQGVAYIVEWTIVGPAMGLICRASPSGAR